MNAGWPKGRFSCAVFVSSLGATGCHRCHFLSGFVQVWQTPALEVIGNTGLPCKFTRRRSQVRALLVPFSYQQVAGIYIGAGRKPADLRDPSRRSVLRHRRPRTWPSKDRMLMRFPGFEPSLIGCWLLPAPQPRYLPRR